MKSEIWIDAPPFNNSQIIAKAEDLFERYRSCVGTDAVLRYGLRFENVYKEVIFPEYGIDWVEGCELGQDASGSKVLARYDPVENVVYIDKVIGPDSGDPRRAFTLWHEFGGHGVLQGAWLRNQIKSIHIGKSVVTTEVSISESNRSKLETQANLFAANAAAPLWLVKKAIVEVLIPTHRFRYLGPCEYCLTANDVTIRRQVDTIDDLYRFIAKQIQPLFGGLSVECLSYRVARTRYVLDRTMKSGITSGFTLERVAS